MQYSRASIVGMLLAAEAVLVGLMIFVVRGGFGGGNVFASSGMHRVEFRAQTIAPIAAGYAPHVVIDDADSFVTVKPSSDGLVHAVDDTNVSGAIWSSGTIAQLRMFRTLDGVRVERAHSPHGFFSLGWLNQAISVEVPSGSRLDVARAGGADVTGINNTVSVESLDGRVLLAQINGDVSAHSNDGRIIATDIRGDSVRLSTSDGRVIMRNVVANTLDARTNDGRIEAQQLETEGPSPHFSMHTNDGPLHIAGKFAANGTYELSTDDGRVELALASGSDVTVNASTNDGSLYVDGQSYGGGGSSHTARVGSGSGTLRVTSGDGSMHITTNGAF